MMRESQPGHIVIECHTDHVEHAAGFWSEALGWPSEMNEDDNCASLFEPGGRIGLVVQGVHEQPGMHVEIETGDMQAEIRRLTDIGARKVGVAGHSVVMEAPTGHLFRIVSRGDGQA